MRGKTIRQFLIDGQADGRWVSELSNWTGKAYKIPRTYVNACNNRKDLNNTGVYFSLGAMMKQMQSRCILEKLKIY